MHYALALSQLLLKAATFCTSFFFFGLEALQTPVLLNAQSHFLLTFGLWSTGHIVKELSEIEMLFLCFQIALLLPKEKKNKEERHAVTTLNLLGKLMYSKVSHWHCTTKECLSI